MTLSNFAKLKRWGSEVGSTLFHGFYCESYYCILQLLGSSFCFPIYSQMLEFYVNLAKNSKNILVSISTICAFLSKCSCTPPKL